MTFNATPLPEPTYPMAARWSLSIALGLTIATVIAGVATVLGLAPWLFLAVFGLAGTFLLAPRLGWGPSAWLTAIVALFSSSWILVVNPYVGVRLDIVTVAVLSIIIVVALVVVWRSRWHTLSGLPRIRVLDGLLAVAPAAVTAVAFYGVSVVRGMPLSWAMRGDAQFNTVLSRHVATGNGETLDNVQVLSLAQGLMATVHLPGRENLAADDLLLHDIASQANLWILMILLSSVLAGAIAECVLRTAPRPLRYIAILAAAALPLSWHMTGYAMESGFYNVSLAFFAIELAFYFWLVTSKSPLWGSVVLLAVTVIMLGAWTPMAIIPLSLAGWSAWQGLRATPPRSLVGVWIAAAVQFVVFVAVFILPGFFSKGAILSANGTILPLNRSLYVAVTALAIIISVAIGLARSKSAQTDRWPHTGHRFAVGVVLIAFSAALGTSFLVFQNRHLPDPWIYYPIKFAWVSMEILILLIFIGACLIVTRLGRQRLVAVTAVGASAVFLVSVLQLNPPRENYGTASFPILSLAKNPSPQDDTLALLTSVSGEKVFFSRYLGSELDTFMNQWQFQITAKDEFTPIRGYAYRVVTTVLDVCDAAKTWGGGVQVVTASPAWADTLNARCGSLLTAVVRDPIDR